MFVEKIELYGFKSFAQKTEIRLSRGFTGIVGPNGCGKSNICDAVRWVLGEQNIRLIRGHSLQDVIFNGTRDVRPLGMAEVTLTLDNRDGRLPVPYQQVAIRRRVFRSGESQFFINQSPCRLKDIRTLFLDTGLGSFAYSVITREMVDAVLSEKDDARRMLFEEAAGISRYKVRRRETLLKLEGTDRNLTRLQDILDVEERELRSLARQVGKTRRYQKLRDAIRSLEILVAWRQWQELAREEESLGRDHAEVARRRLSLETRIRDAESRLEPLRLQLLRGDEELEKAQGELDAVQEEARRASDRLIALRERGEALEERLEALRERQEALRAKEARLGERMETLRPRIAELEAELTERNAACAEAEAAVAAADRELRSARAELARLQQRGLLGMEREAALRALWSQAHQRLRGLRQRLEVAADQERELEGRIQALEAEASGLGQERARLLQAGEERGAALREARERAEEVERELEAVRADLARILERLRALEAQRQLLEEQSAAYEGYVQATRRLLERREALPGLLGPLGDLLKVDEAWAERLGLALGEMIHWIVVETTEDARRAAAWAREHGLGMVTFLPLDGLRPAGGDAEGNLPPGVLDAVPEAKPLVAFLGRMLCLDRPGGAEPEPWQILLKEDGSVRGGWGWQRVSGAGSPAQEILSRRPRLDALRREAETLSAERERLETEVRRLREMLEETAETRRALESELEELERRRLVAERKLSEVELETRLLREERDRLRQERTQLAAESEDHRDAWEVLSVRRWLLGRGEVQSESRLEDLEARVATLEAEKEARQKAYGSLRLEALRTDGALRETRRELARLEEELAALRGERDELVEEERRLRRERQEGEEETNRLAASLETLIRRREEMRRHLEARRAERTRLQSEQMEAEKGVREWRRQLSELQDDLREREVRLAEVRSRRERIREGILQEHRFDLAHGLPDPPPWSAEDEELDTEAAQARLAELREKLERLGPVNLLAVTGYEEKKERVRFLREQKRDLEGAKQRLLEAIERINERARQLFLETFRQVEDHFQRTFQSLFPGGEARLLLAEEDPLEATIEIQARPRGKKLESIRLLSTGERALTATALLFALYLVKPSPFCILDEVDAPLDDANTERFVRMLRHFSDRTQFVVITHNKRTMEAADVLYGVTMEEPGISKIVSVRLREGGELAPAATQAEA
jgi:chromosome segregation protein